MLTFKFVKPGSEEIRLARMVPNDAVPKQTQRNQKMRHLSIKGLFKLRTVRSIRERRGSSSQGCSGRGGVPFLYTI